ncbi:MAG: hypothetical protein EOL98_03865 [Negativicutes bacterium]|nr:hypothetical protein [Negativicutes bacterium]
MKKKQSIGIIAEYNPFHNGHAHHLAETRKLVGEDLPVIAVMSGNFVQRGLPAMTDKWSRATIAVKNGVDLVLELPTIFACRSAEHFARGGISLLKATGCISYLSFGCETNNLQLLEQAAQFACRNNSDCQAELAKGLSYAAAVGTAMAKENPSLATIVEQPNNILAIEYLKHIELLKAGFTPIPVNRMSSMYNDKSISGSIASATAIRTEFLSHGLNNNIAQAVPAPTLKILEELYEKTRLGFNQTNLDLLLIFLLRQISPTDIAERCECSEGLENKIFKAAAASDWFKAVSMIKSKRYPETRINRLLLQLLLSSSETNFKEAISEHPSYLRVLAFNNRGRQLLKNMRNTCELPIVNKLGREILHEGTANKNIVSSLKIDISATELFSLLQNNSLPYAADFKTSPIYLPE